MTESERCSWEDAVRWLRSQSDQSQLIRDCFYDDPIASAAERYYDSTEWGAVRFLLPDKKGRALDIGAGRGISSYALAKDGWNVTSLEPDASDLVGAGAIRRLQVETGRNWDVIEQWGESLPFEDESFGLVYCRAVLHHAKSLHTLCREISRVLKRGGYLVATREHVISKSADLDTFLKAHPLHGLYGGENAYQLRMYVDCIESAKLEVKATINPYASDVNLFPSNRQSVRERLAARLRVPARLVPNFVLSLYGHMDSAPGRLYSFVARKIR